MRLLYVIDSLAPGGAETSLATTSSGLIANGIELHVLPLLPRLDLAADLEKSGATVHASPTGGRRENVLKVRALARQVRPHLVHTTLFEADVAGRLGARLASVPASTSWVSDSYGPEHWAEVNHAKLWAARQLDRETARLAGRFHAVSSTVATNVGTRLKVPLVKIHTIPRGRDPQRFAPADQITKLELRQRLGLPKTRPIILAVGRHEPAKGLDTLLRALPLLGAIPDPPVVLMAGAEGNSSRTIRTLANSVPVEVHLLGHRKDIPDLLAAADVLCFPSNREGSPGVLIEALAAGCPVIASNIPPNLEILEGSAGLLGQVVPPGDPEALANVLTTTLRGNGNATMLAAAGRQHFRDKYALASVTDQMARFFRAAADASGWPPTPTH